jgi:sucrose-phosphate synthase
MSDTLRKRYFLLVSVHGLIRANDLELGRDADTGGQTKYVVDLARSLAGHPEVGRVDLVTRRIVDPNTGSDYAQPFERITDNCQIVRIDAGPEGYIFKEQLWDHLDSFTDNLIDWIQQQDQPPDIVHSHYADGGYVGVRVANLLGVPLVHTGHSLGRDKRKRLLARGLKRDEIERKYNMSRRIDAEEEILANADLVITSTNNEVEQQYGLYNYYDPSRMAVIPPGTDLGQFHPPQGKEKIAFVRQLAQFLKNPKKPLIVALSRPDERKNLLTLIEAYGESPALRETANLLIVAGNREDIRDMEAGPRTVLTNVLLLIDLYNLYGKVAVPKRHRPAEVPEIYRLASRLHGVFINPALTEPFGLTLLEAAASGLPVVATENGGPVDIIENCRNGELVDPLDKEAIAAALLKLLQSDSDWQRASRNGITGVRKHYSWQSHAESYLSRIRTLDRQVRVAAPTVPPKKRYRNRAIFSDLDQNLIGNPSALRAFLDVVRENRKCVVFGIATGRRIDRALSAMQKHKIPIPDVLISSLGTRIHYGKDLTEDDFWRDHIDHHWNPDRVRRVLADCPGLKPQPMADQSSHKVSFYYDEQKAPSIEEIVDLLRQREVTANVIHSFGQFLDVIPSRASKGLALRYVAQQLEIPLENVLAAGGSGADEDMMRGNTLAVVVGNRHHEELSALVDMERIYFAQKPHALGILEAIEHYDFFASCDVPDE